MLARIKEDDQTVPYRRGGYFYYSRTETGKQYPILCRRAGSPTRPRRSRLDLNALAEGHPFFALGVYAVSDDGRCLAYSTDFTGFREYTLSVKDLRDRRRCAPDRIEKVVGVAWAADPSDALLRDRGRGQAAVPALPPPARAPGRPTTLVYEETDALFRLHVWRSRSRAFLFAMLRAASPPRRCATSPPTDPDGGLDACWPRASRTTSTTSTTGGDRVLHPHQRAAAGGTSAWSPRPSTTPAPSAGAS